MRANDRISGQAYVIVQVSNSNVVVVLNVHEVLTGVGKFDLRFHYVDFSNSADAELGVDIAQVLLQSQNLFFVDFD